MASKERGTLRRIFWAVVVTNLLLGVLIYGLFL